MSIEFIGHFWGCGHCGSMLPVGDPGVGKCCGFARAWWDRFIRGIQGTDYCEEPPVEDRARGMRWERVVRRWETKHA